MLLMFGRAEENLIVKLLGSIPEKGISFRQLAWKSGMDRETVRKYVRIVVQIQESPRIRLETVGLRVLVSKEKPAPEKTGCVGCPPGQARVR